MTEHKEMVRTKDYKSAALFRSLPGIFSFAKQPWGWLLIALLLALLLKLSLLAANVVPFNSDEAVVALMARHILQGDRPIFFYGQAYMGSLDAWLVAAAFKVFGEGVLSIRLVQVYLYMAYLISMWLLASALFTDRLASILAVFLGAVPVVAMTTFTTASLGGYSETLVFGNLILWIGFQIAYGRWHEHKFAWFAFGLVAGLAFWTLALSLVYLISVALVIILRTWRGLLQKKILWVGVLISLAGFALGSLPWWIANLTGGWEPLYVLLHPPMVETTLLQRLTAFSLIGLPTMIGIRFPWAGELSPFPLALGSVLFYVIVIGILIFAGRKGRLPLSPGAGALLATFTGCFLLIFLASRNGIDATGRYLLPLSTILLLVTAVAITVAWRKRVILGAAMVVFALCISGIETGRAASSPNGILTRFDIETQFSDASDSELMAFLQENGEQRGYTTYWVSFRLAFLSSEQLLFAARLPYKQDLTYLPVDDRIPSYSQQVDKSTRVAYITHLQPAVDQILRGELRFRGISYQEKQIGPYHIFYALSQPLRPEEINWSK